MLYTPHTPCVADSHTNEENISSYNFSGGTTLGLEGSQLTATCTSKCTVICLDNNDIIVIYWTFGGNKIQHRIPLPSGNYRCTGLYEGVFHEIFHHITIEDPGNVRILLQHKHVPLRKRHTVTLHSINMASVVVHCVHVLIIIYTPTISTLLQFLLIQKTP